MTRHDITSHVLGRPDIRAQEEPRLNGQCRGNITYVARDLGKARLQIHRWMQRFDLDPAAFRG